MKIALNYLKIYLSSFVIQKIQIKTMPNHNNLKLVKKKKPQELLLRLGERVLLGPGSQRVRRAEAPGTCPPGPGEPEGPQS